jgi:hypothetical protein
MNSTFPRMIGLRQKFPVTPPVAIRAVLQREFESQGILARLKPGARIAVAAGSRGISNLQTVIAEVVSILKAAGVQPFVIPAMGSHGGATPEGQTELLKEYGVTEEKVQAPIRASLDVERIGVTAEGIEVYCSTEALRADGVVVVNRVKPHTDFSGLIGSGILKMLVIGLGKRVGAANFHAAATRLGYEPAIRSVAREVLRSAPILCGVAIVENQIHDTARIAVLKPEEIERREEELFQEAKRLMPKLPFDDIDLLIVDRLGKNISGAGMDPNITGRGKQGPAFSAGDKGPPSLVIRRIFVRDLTPETRGNAIGIGFADFTTARAVQGMDKQVTYINSLTSLTTNGAKIPIHFETDREVLTQALASLGIPDVRQAKVVRIADTLSIENVEVSEAYAGLIPQNKLLETIRAAEEIRFDAADNLEDLGT